MKDENDGPIRWVKHRPQSSTPPGAGIKVSGMTISEFNKAFAELEAAKRQGLVSATPAEIAADAVARGLLRFMGHPEAGTGADPPPMGTLQEKDNTDRGASCGESVCKTKKNRDQVDLATNQDV